MNNTRKKLITILSDYMDKTLSEWCIILLDKPNIDFWICININNKEIKYKSILIKWWLSELYNSKEWEWYIHKDNILKSIWHYDITAVLKYIYNLGYDISIDTWTTDKEILVFIKKDDYHIWQLLFKPLHLYTEQEDEDLYKLLKQLWKE